MAQYERCCLLCFRVPSRTSLKLSLFDSLGKYISSLGVKKFVSPYILPKAVFAKDNGPLLSVCISFGVLNVKQGIRPKGVSFFF